MAPASRSARHALTCGVGQRLGDFRLDVTAALLLGSIPGVVLGALVSSRAPAGLIRRALALVLLASGLKLRGVSTTATAVVMVTCIILGPLAWMGARRRHGLPALRHQASVRVHRPELGAEATEE